MSCKIIGVYIDFDTTGRINKAINSFEVSANNVKRVVLLANEVNNNLAEVIKTANDHLTAIGKEPIAFEGVSRAEVIGSLSRVNANTLKKILNNHFKRVNLSVSDYVTMRTADELMGFSNHEAKTFAKEFTGTKIIQLYRTRFNQLDGNYNALFSLVRSELEKDYNQIKLDTLRLIEANGKEDKNTDIEKQFARWRELATLRKEISDKARNSELSKEEKDKLREQFEAYGVERNTIERNLIEKYGDDKINNYKALIDNLQTHPVEWFTEVTALAKVNQVVKNIKKGINEEIYDDDALETEDDFVNESADIDTNTGWDKGKVQNDYQKLIDESFKLYLSTELYKLSSPYSEANGGTYSYYRENPLGAKETYDGKWLFEQLYKFVKDDGALTSREALINKLSDMSQNIPEFYGIQPLVARMKQEADFANMVFKNFSSYRVKKYIVTINNDGSFITARSNNAADARIKEYTDFINGFKYHFEYLNLDSLKGYNISESVEKKTDVIYNLLKTINPYIKRENVYAYIKSVDKKQEETTFVNNLRQLLVKADSFYKQFNAAREANSKEWSKWNSARRQLVNDVVSGIAQSSELDKFSAEPRFYRENAIDFEDAALVKLISEITDELHPFMTTNIENNSPNAKGNQSSNLIANSHISNLYETIKENKDGKGLKQLAQEWQGITQIKDNPFFFGIRDNNGRIIVPGLFVEVDGKLKVNPEFADNFDMFLFDGIRDENLTNAIQYAEASKGDYMISQFLTYMQGISERGVRKNNILNFFLNTPSDALKNFVMSIPGVETSDMFMLEESDRTIVAQEFDNKVRRYVIKPNFKYDGTNLDINKNRVNVDTFWKLVNGEITSVGRNEYQFDTIYTEDNREVRNYNHLRVNLELGDTTLSLMLVTEYNRNTRSIVVKGVQNIYNLQRTGENKYDFIDTISTADEHMFSDAIVDTLYKNNTLERKINNNNQLFLGYKQILYSELYHFVNQLNNILEKDNNNGKDNENGNNLYVKTKTDGLIGNYHHKGGKIYDNGKLVGNVFHFTNLFNIGKLNIDEEISNAISLYGGETAGSIFTMNGGRLMFNPKVAAQSGILFNNEGKLYFEKTEKLDGLIDGLVRSWMTAFYNDTKTTFDEYYASLANDVLEKTTYTVEDVVKFNMATTYARMATEPLLTGDSKFYAKSATDLRTFLKRSKEVQAGGQIYYGGDVYGEHGKEIRNIQHNNQDEYIADTVESYVDEKGNVAYRRVPLYARNGFRAITIQNTNKTSENSDSIERQVRASLELKFNKEKDKDTIERLVQSLVEPFRVAKTKVNDAQSYITWEEFIRRRHADGSIAQYRDLIEQVNKLRSKEITLAEFDLQSFNARVQVQKNFYFDIQRDDATGVMYPRQIKNAEFVIIPELVEGTELETLYKAMAQTGIDQINTIETSKAANRKVITFWDNNQNVVDYDSFVREISPVEGNYNKDVVENYYYRNLWKQQDVAQHIGDTENKAGIQFTKKIIDNAPVHLQPLVKRFMDNYGANVNEAYHQMIYNMGWKINKNGELVNIHNNNPRLDFTEFYRRAREEAERLGLDSNFAEYFTVDEITGKTKMPNYMNINNEKLENVAQALFNSNIRKQTLPGWHAAQIASVGFDVVDSAGVKHRLGYHRSEDENYVEILIPRWSKNIRKYQPSKQNEGESTADYYTRIKKEQQEFDKAELKKLEDAGLLDQIIYRIPTEGKQSMAVAKVVGFLDEAYGSTVVVPNEWVTQTGSDFDVDSVYAVTKEFYYDEKNDKYVEIGGKNDDYKPTDKQRYINYVTNLIRNSKTQTGLREVKEYRNQARDARKTAWEKAQDELDKLGEEIVSPKFRKENYEQFNKILNSLPEVVQIKLKSAMANINKAYSSDYRARDKHYKEKIDLFINHPKVPESVKTELKKLNDLIDERMITFEKLNERGRIKFDAFKTSKLAEATYFNAISRIAKENGIIGFEEFNKLEEPNKKSKAERNNEIVNAAIDILKNSYSFEENMSRSNFDDITDANNYIKGIQSRNKTNHAVSNTFSQIQFMEDAIMGARLKARSVQRDTFLSVSNKIKTKLDNPIKIKYDLSRNPQRIITNEVVSHDQMGWSDDGNRNILGRLITVYSSQTTAHILDAVKEGAIFNETEDTFAVFKTFVDLGSDYIFAAGFLAQPAITRLVNRFNETNSIYNDDKSNAITATLADILQEAGRTDVSAYSSKSYIYKVASEVFGFKQANYNDYQNAIEYSEKDMYDAIEGNNVTLEQQFETIALFDKLNDIAREIDDCVNLANPDKFGAKQTVRSTKQVINKALKLETKKHTHLSAVDNNGIRGSVIGALYPGLFNETGLNENHSAYKYLASFLKYVTLPSITINSILFSLESPAISNGYAEMVELYNYLLNANSLEEGDITWEELSKHLGVAEKIEYALGITLSDKDYTNLKKYIIASQFLNIRALTDPITVNEFGYIVPSTGEQTEAVVGIDDSYWTAERKRIYGFGNQGYRNVKIADITNPTKEEIDEYRQLSPAQKVDWIKHHFRNDGMIFDYLDVNYTNYGVKKSIGVDGTAIRFQSAHDIETLYTAFRKAAFNKNPLVKLAAADLVKYAFIVEGNNFKSGSISRIITNDFLYSTQSQGGFTTEEYNSFTDQLEDAIYNINTNEFNTEEFIEKFVRQNPDIVKVINISKRKAKDVTGRQISEYDIMQNFAREGGAYIIPAGFEQYSAESKLLVKFMSLSKESPIGYCRLKDSNGNLKLYRIQKIKNENGYQGLYLYPIGTLEAGEFSDYSVNPENNAQVKSETFQQVVESLTKKGIIINKEKRTATYSYTLESDDMVKPIIITTQQLENKDNTEFITALEDNVDAEFVGGINNLVAQLKDFDVSPVEGNDIARRRIVGTINPKLLQYIANHKQFSQVLDIEVDGETQRAEFVFMPISGQVKAKINAAIQDYIKTGKKYYVKGLPTANSIIDYLTSDKNVARLAYKFNMMYAELVPFVSEEAAQVDEENAEARENELYAGTKLIIGTTNQNTAKIPQLSRFVGQLTNVLIRQSNKSENKLLRDFSYKTQTGELNTQDMASIMKNQKGILMTAAEYYRQEAIKLKQRLEHYVMEGEEYALNDPKLYEELVKHPEYYDDLVDLILYARNFGSDIYDIFKLDVTTENHDIQSAIQTIKDSIDSIRNSANIVGENGAMKHIFDIYIAKAYANNPLVRHELVNLRTQYGDVNWFDLQLSDAGHINNKQIQTVVKLVYTILDEVRDIVAPDMTRKFLSDYDEIMKKGNINMNHVIDKQGRYVQKYNEQYLEDKEKVTNTWIDAKVKYGTYSVEAERARLARDKWFAENVEQQLVKEYYDKRNALLEEILNKAPEYYVKYMKLRDELANYNNKLDNMTEDELKEFKNIQIQINQLRSVWKATPAVEEDEFGNLFTVEGQIDHEAEALDNYIKGVQALNFEYKEEIPGEAWGKTMQYYLGVVEAYDKAHPGQALNVKLQNQSYNEAYTWIQRNSTYQMDDSVRKKLSDAFKALRNGEDYRNEALYKFMRDNNFLDKWGRFDGRKLTLEQQASIVRAFSNTTNLANDNYFSDGMIINQVRSEKPIYKNDFYSMLYKGNSTQSSIERNEIIGKINKALINLNCVTDKGIDMMALMKHATNEQLEDIRKLVFELYDIREGKFTKEDRDRIEANSRMVLDDDRFKAEMRSVEAAYKTTNPAKYITWLQIFAAHDFETGSFKRDLNGIVANSLFYGYRAPLKEQEDMYRDKDKENARNYINENVEFITNEYYKEAYEKAIADGNFEEWFAANHIYNTYKHTYEPTRIWTNMVLKGMATKNAYKYIPTFDNVERQPKEKYRNKNYTTYGSRYKADTGRYTNAAYNSLTATEREMLNLLTSVANKYVINNGQKAFAQTYAPRLMAHKADKKFWRNVILDSLGINYHVANNQQFHENIGYKYDTDPDFQMFNLLKTKESKERIKLRDRLEGETDEQWSKYVNEVHKENTEIDKNNLEIDNGMFNDNWRDVFARLVTEGENYLARNKAKNTLYLLLEDLMTNDAIKSNWKTEQPMVSNRESNGADNINYMTEKQTNAFKIMTTFARRVIYDEYKKQSKLNSAARVLQGFTSAKYMMLNLHGGIANVSTGLVNILGEDFGGDFFSHKDWNWAGVRYGSSITSFLADIYREDASSDTNALLKFMNVVDYDEITGRLEKADSAVQAAKFLNDFLYSTSSMGEHYMQNRVALAMLNASRVYTDENGNYKIGTINDYTRDVEINLLRQILMEYGDNYQVNGHSIVEIFNKYISQIKNDKAFAKDFDTFKKDVCMDFIKLITKQTNGNTKLAKEFISRREKAIADAKANFEKEEKLYDQFEFIKTDGVHRIARIKKNSKLNITADNKFDESVGNKKAVEFNRRVIYVNKYIHGVYDKLGRATIENEFWGSFAMQYHKHIYPGIMKRYRGLFGGRGYYNELRQQVEVGSHVSLLRFLGTEFANANIRKKTFIDENGNTVTEQISALEGLQNVMHAAIATIINMSMNWQMLPVREQRNIKRALGDFFGILGTAALVLAMYALWDDDDFKDNILAANMLYTANRCFSEAFMWTPTGLISEWESLYSSPIAGGSNVNDMIKAMSIISSTLFDDDFDPMYHTGQYRGRYKLEVLFTRNIPVYRIYKNILNMGAKNSYYNGSTSNSAAQQTLKKVGEKINK